MNSINLAGFTNTEAEEILAMERDRRGRKSEIEAQMKHYGRAEVDAEDEEAAAHEQARRDGVSEEIQHRIYRGEVEATDADGVQTMRDLQ